MTGAWYYAAMVYDMPTFQLYVTTRADYFDCQGGASLPTCDPAVEDQHYGEIKTSSLVSQLLVHSLIIRCSCIHSSYITFEFLFSVIFIQVLWSPEIAVFKLD